MIAAMETTLQSLLLLAIRLFWGASFCLGGWQKLHEIASISNYFSSLNIPFPTFNAYIVGSIECFGGLCLFLGFASRLVSIPLICVMVVAYLTAHHEALTHAWIHPKDVVAQPPFNFLLAALIVLAFGPGKVSVDYFITRRRDD